MTYDVYLGTTVDGLTLVSENQAEAAYTPPASLAFNTTYYWRVDARNENGTTQGDVWSFTTLVFDPPLPNGINNMMTPRRLVAVAGGALWYENL